ncbi:MAG TPA: zinc ribbon domain-containing protein, partial [Candidatus Lokiarchaeia archaeon]|nr:zinc ribbon domain-containing protein [Candidatus Lokiarchaeia archaeon]
LYIFTFANFSKDVSQLNYTVVGVDIFGNLYPLGKIDSIIVFPAMPAWNMDNAEQAVVIILSVIIGVVCGVIYSKIVQKKPSLRELTLAEKARLDIAENKLEIAEGERQEKLARLLAARVVPTVVTVVIMGGLLGMAVAALIVFHEPELSMLLLAGLFLATTFMWVLVTDAVVVKTLRSGQLKISTGSMILVLGVGFSIFLTLLAIIFVGNTVTWWQVRVNQAAYNVMNFEIPKMLSSLASAFFSSIILLSWTVGKDVSRTASELHEDELDHANPGTLMERREDALSRIQGAVGMKGIIFIALIGVTIILASDLSIYVSQGLLIIVPFVIGTFAILAVNAFRKKLAPQVEADIRYDHVTTCPECGADTALGGLFCENCGVKIIGGTRIHDGVECPQCRMLNAASGNHCRYCGANLESALASIPASNVEEPPEPDAAPE